MDLRDAEENHTKVWSPARMGRPGKENDQQDVWVLAFHSWADGGAFQ